MTHWKSVTIYLVHSRIGLQVKNRSSVGTWNDTEKISMASRSDVLMTRTESRSVHLPYSGSKAGVVKRRFE